ncbi:hypothetical protein ABZ392_33920 [Streptomyces sp. NPDC005885]|uniref:hypothetical protein n=1 Tax=Streptomyces sp. NPDC005885 TaxID=3157079 RepID=UPI0033E891C5
MRPSALLITGILTAALLTSCDHSTNTDCENAALHPSPVAQAAPVAPDKPRPKPRKTTKPRTTKPKPKVTPKPKLRHHDDHDCDDD